MMETFAKVKRKLKRKFGFQHLLRSDFRVQKRALIVHGLHKSASMFLFKFFDHISREIQVPLYSIHNTPANDQDLGSELDQSFICCPERSFLTDNFQFKNLTQQHLFQTRDPRDILVSEYFSLGWRHSDRNWDKSEKSRRQKIKDLTIDEYVRNEPELSKYPLLARFEPLLELLKQTDDREDTNDLPSSKATCLVKYETMIRDFPTWLAKVLPLIGLNTAADVSYLADHYRNEFQPEQNTGAHKRNVTPGDHKTKLKPATIDLLNSRFSQVLEALDY